MRKSAEINPSPFLAEAYVARLIIHRYAMLNILTEEGYPVERMGVMVEEEQGGDIVMAQQREALLGARCKECGNHHKGDRFI